MARNEEKALTLFNKWHTFKKDFHSSKQHDVAPLISVLNAFECVIKFTFGRCDIYLALITHHCHYNIYPTPRRYLMIVVCLL